MAKKTRAPRMTLEQADAHQRKHGFKPLISTARCEAAAEPQQKKTKLRNVRLREPNRIEREFRMLLEARLRTGELLDVKFEGVRLLWGGGMTYTCDWAARRADGRVEVHECKGARYSSRDLVRFKGCRHEWQQWFDFFFHQRSKEGQWTRLL